MSSDLLASATANFGPQRQVHPELEHLAGTMPPPASPADLNHRSQSRMSISHAKGLLNMPGQNNCFLNSAVQVLWHLDVFRRSFRELRGHACMGDSCIFCALKELFHEFQSSKESALPPDSLRLALAEAFSDQRRFQLGFMDDAAECFENILFRIHYHITNREIDTSSTCLAHCIPHQKFAMSLYEQVVCHSCGAASEPFVFSQMVHYTSTSALSVQAKQAFDTGANFGQLLKMANSMGDQRNCPKLCGARVNLSRLLINRPDIVSIGLVWDSEHPTLSTIRNIYQMIDTEIQLSQLFDLRIQSGQSDRFQLNLVGLVTYYGKHYSTYLYQSKLCQWIYFDDATVRVVGPCWQHVVDKCIKGHFQPLLLLYSNPNGTTINTQQAFRNIVPMTAIKKSNSNDNKKQQPPSSIKVVNSLNTQFQNENVKSAVEFGGDLNKTQNLRYYSDVPDSPSATSTTSYFSDVGDSTDGYISRRTVENIIKIHQKSSKMQNKLQEDNIMNFNKNYNRNSSSSLESFDSTVRSNTLPRNVTKNSTLLACSLQRRDSGNSSGDRSSIEPPFRRTLQNSVYHKTNKSSSDQGYDSFSLSSSDSYPSTATSPSKLNSKLKQIPEDVQLIDMINALTMDECDKLCSEADILLLKSHEKEREGDVRAAAALSDSAAAKARIAMDAPYSNHQTLISAKMKHSMCVLRSASLHKRVQEMEAEEKRLMRASQEMIHHSRQGSRDSTHGKHSRQGSRDSKDPKHAKESKFGQTNRINPVSPTPNIELYATLPKKAKKKVLKTSCEEIRHASFKESEETSKNSILKQLQMEKTNNKKSKGNDVVRESEFSDYYSEWEGLKKKSVANKISSNSQSGWQSCRENDSECYGELAIPARKQNKVKRKLLLGNFLKTKNRSLPDLREDMIKEKELSKKNGEEVTGNNPRVAVANVSAKGFHQPHRSFVAEQGLQTKPLLIKVMPPLLTESPKKQKMLSDARLAKPTQQVENEPPVRSMSGSGVAFLEPNLIRHNQINSNGDISSVDNLPIKPKKPTPLDIAEFISKNSIKGSHMYGNQVQGKSSTSGNIHVPIPVHLTGAMQSTSNSVRPSRPPDYETAIKRLNENITFAAPPKPALNHAYPAVINSLKVDLRRRPIDNSLFTAVKTQVSERQIGGKSTGLHQIDSSTHCERQKITIKKSVKFSDHIEWVACADEDPEEHLPNPLIEKVLGRQYF